VCSTLSINPANGEFIKNIQAQVGDTDIEALKIISSTGAILYKGTSSAPVQNFFFEATE
jgi:hypothetical protein